MFSVKSLSLNINVVNNPVSLKNNLNFPRSLLFDIPALGSLAWYDTSTVFESFSSAIDSRIFSALSPFKTLETWYLEAFLLSCAGIASNRLDNFPVGSIFLKSSSYRLRISLFIWSTFLKLFVSIYSFTACGIPPTSIYKRKSLISFLWIWAPTGFPESNTFFSNGIVVISPTAHRNSSWSIGYILIFRSSLGISISFTLRLIEINEPVST